MGIKLEYFLLIRYHLVYQISFLFLSQRNLHQYVTAKRKNIVTQTNNDNCYTSVTIPATVILLIALILILVYKKRFSEYHKNIMNYILFLLIWLNNVNEQVDFLNVINYNMIHYYLFVAIFAVCTYKYTFYLYHFII